MSAPARSAPKHPRRIAVPALVAFCFFITLFPPLQWIVGDGGVWFFIVTGALVLLALWAMYVIDARAEAAEVAGSSESARTPASGPAQAEAPGSETEASR